MIENQGATAGMKPQPPPSTPLTPTKSQPRPATPSSHVKSATGQILARRERVAREAVFPDLRNIGILARALVLYIAMVAAYTIAVSVRPVDVVLNLSVTLADSLPIAATLAAAWAMGSPALRRLAYWQAAALMMVFTVVVSLMTSRWLGVPSWRAAPLALIAFAAVLIYFHTLGRALSPTVTEARLQALQARIRPHFLFNSINGVLGVLRADPKRAEAALMDMADLFRVLMRENRDLQPIADEITLTRQYLDLEKLRLGERLNVLWKLDKMPADALVPPLVLQPIAENAVYHGIEPTQAAGTIEIEVARLRSELIITVKNPFLEQAGAHHGGNKMAMSNIRDRLALHFDAEARMVSGPRDGRYQVQLVLPYRKSLDTKAMV
jgi:two-component system, LytTR family, sensor histidine kinase AlgZ